MTTPLNRNQQVPQQTPTADATSSKKTEGSADATNLSSVKTIKESMENITEKKDLSDKKVTKNSHDSEILSKTKDMSPVKTSSPKITTLEDQLKAQQKEIAALKKEVGEEIDPFKYEEDRKEERDKKAAETQNKKYLERLAQLEAQQLELNKEIEMLSNGESDNKIETNKEKTDEKPLSSKEKLIKEQQEEIEKFKKGLGSKEENKPTSDKKTLISENEASIERLKREIASKDENNPKTDKKNVISENEATIVRLKREIASKEGSNPKTDKINENQQAIERLKKGLGMEEKVLSPKEKALKEQQAEIEQFRKMHQAEAKNLSPKAKALKEQQAEIEQFRKIHGGEGEKLNPKQEQFRDQLQEINEIKKQLSENEKLQAEKVAAQLAEGKKELERLNEEKRLKELNKQEAKPKAEKTEVKIHKPPSKKEDDGCVIS